MNIKDNWPALLLAFGSMLVIFATYKLGQQDSQQKNRIEDTVNVTNRLSAEIKNLQELDTSLSHKITTIVSNTGEVTTKAAEVTTNTNTLVEDVKLLTEQTKGLITKINQRTTYEAAENLATGELKLNFAASSQEFFLDIGIHTGIPSSSLRSGEFFKQLLPGLNFEPVLMEIKANKLVLTFSIFDPDGNQIAQVKENNWRPNRNFTGRFNYDDYGFEVIDNQGNVAIGIDILSNNKVSIQGVFRSRIQKRMVISSGKDFVLLPFKNPEIENNTKIDGQPYEVYVDQLISSTQPLFEYFGKDWLHKRVRPRVKQLSNPYYNLNRRLNEPHIKADFLIPRVPIIIPYKSKKYNSKVISVDHLKPERVYIAVEEWNGIPGISNMMLERTAGKNMDQWTNSRPMDIHDPDFIAAAIKELEKLIANNNFLNPAP